MLQDNDLALTNIFKFPADEFQVMLILSRGINYLQIITNSQKIRIKKILSLNFCLYLNKYFTADYREEESQI